MRLARVALGVVVTVAWVLVGWLAIRLLGSGLETAWYYRIATVWGAAEGSLLLFVAIVATCAAITARYTRRAAVVWGATATMVVLLVANLVLANPFGWTPNLTPILEHPAMAVHPPFLYTGLGLTLAMVMAAADGRGVARSARWTAATICAAMTLGAVWSYVEQGWGGYWAWDPVENVSLLVWLVTLAVLHASWSPRWAAAPWLTTLVGSAMVRSGRTPSVHGFAEHAGVGWTFVAVAVASVAWWWMIPTADRLASGSEPRSPQAATAAAQRPAAVVLAVIAALVAVGTFAPAVAGWVSGRRLAVRGEFFARAVGPLAVVGFVLIVAAMAGTRRIGRGRTLLAHAGVLVLVAGVAVSTFDSRTRVRVIAGVPVNVHGVRIVSEPARVTAGPRTNSSRVTVAMRVNGRAVEPSLVAYPDLGGVLAETAVIVGPLADTQIAVVTADDDGGAVVDVHRRPMVWLLWLGALLTTAGVVPRRRAAGACAPATR